MPTLDKVIGPSLSAGGASTRRRHGITTSRCAQSGGRSCGQKSRRVAGEEEPVQVQFRDLFAHGRSSQAALDSHSTTDVGRPVPAEEGAASEASEWELRESRELEEEKGAGRGEGGGGGGVGGTAAVPTHTFLHGIRGRGVGERPAFLAAFLYYFRCA